MAKSNNCTSEETIIAVKDYLFHNTKLETASSARHNFGKLFTEDDEVF